MKKKILLTACMIAAITLTACGDTTTTTTDDTTVITEIEQTIEADDTEEVAEVDDSKIEEEAVEEAVVEEVATEEANEIEPATYNIATLSGPTTMGMIKLMSDSDSGLTDNTYNVTVYSTSDEIVTGIVSGVIDIANVPANMSSVLYNKTSGAIKITDVNTLGVLYVITVGEDITSIEDLIGKTIYTTGKGSTPEYVLRYVLSQNGIDPDNDVTIEFKSESAEVASFMAESESAIAVLPQPYVTVAMNNNENISIALSITDEWDKVCDTTLITGVTIAQNSVIESNTAAFEMFLSDYKASVEYVNENTAEAAALIGEYNIVAEGVAKKALPYCNITLITGEDMKNAVSGYLSILFDADASSVGGSLPDDNAYYLG